MTVVPAVVAEATRRSAVVWLGPPAGRPVPVWHLWHEDAAYVVLGAGEQRLPFPVPEVLVVTVRSRAARGERVVAWLGAVEVVEPGTNRWDEVLPLLRARRLNAPAGDLGARWAAGALLLRLVPTGELVPAPEQELYPASRPTRATR